MNNVLWSNKGYLPLTSLCRTEECSPTDKFPPISLTRLPPVSSHLVNLSEEHIDNHLRQTQRVMGWFSSVDRKGYPRDICW